MEETSDRKGKQESGLQGGRTEELCPCRAESKHHEQWVKAKRSGRKVQLLAVPWDVG